MTAYYNEIDEEAADVLRALIADDVIAPGDVDTRTIKEVQPDDLRGYDQCHFFAGGGLWSVAARLAGWSDDRPLWTGSCPCQPFSSAGKATGTDDPRHLWPDFHRIIRARRPVVVLGEQVAEASGRHWFDGVRSNLEEDDYSCRAVDIPACAVDAPIERSRLYWCAVARANQLFERGYTREPRGKAGQSRGEARSPYGHTVERRDDARCTRDDHSSNRPNGSWWADAERIVGHDGQWRRCKSGLPLLVDGFPGRVGVWRIAGNAISPILAAEVIGALMDIMDERA